MSRKEKYVLGLLFTLCAKGVDKIELSKANEKFGKVIGNWEGFHQDRLGRYIHLIDGYEGMLIREAMHYRLPDDGYIYFCITENTANRILNVNYTNGERETLVRDAERFINA
jgi:hypothetical protein